MLKSPPEMKTPQKPAPWKEYMDKSLADSAEKNRKLIDRIARENKKILDELGRQIGGLGNSAGKELENDVADALASSSDFCGNAISHIYPDMANYTGNPLTAGQFDVVAVNGEYVFVIEVKRNLTMEDVRNFADKQLPRFAEVFPREAQGKKVRGAMVYRRTDKGGNAVAAALKEGFFVLSVNSKKKLHQITTAEQVIKQAKKRAVKKPAIKK